MDRWKTDYNDRKTDNGAVCQSRGNIRRYNRHFYISAQRTAYKHNMIRRFNNNMFYFIMGLKPPYGLIMGYFSKSQSHLVCSFLTCPTKYKHITRRVTKPSFTIIVNPDWLKLVPSDVPACQDGGLGWRCGVRWRWRSGGGGGGVEI